MTENEARVVRIEGGDIWLEGCGACDNCSSAGSCGIGDGRKRLQRFPNTVGARVGDTIVVGVRDGAVLRAALLVYLLPLATTLAGALLGHSTVGESGSIIGAVLGLLVGWLTLKRPRQVPLVSMRLKESIISFHGNPPT